MFSFEKQGANSYLVYQLNANDTIDLLSLGMITNNKIKGITPILFTQMDEDKFLKFNITAKVSVDQFFSRTVNRKRLIGVFSSIADAVINAEEYMIDTNTLLFDLERIYVDVSTCEAIMICLPIVKEDATPVDMLEFIKKIMFSTQFDSTENCDYVAKIINYLNSTPEFSIVDFKNIIDSLNTTNTVQQSAVAMQTQPQPVAPPVAPVQAQSFPHQPPVVNNAIKGPAPQPPVGNVAKSGFQQPSQPAMQKPIAPPQNAQNTASAEPEKKMSYFHLLMHYNKENAQIYKEQKKNKVAQQQQQAPSALMNQINQPPQAPKAKTKADKKSPQGFTIPGTAPQQPTPMPRANPASPMPNIMPQNPAPVAPQNPISQPQSITPPMPVQQATVVQSGNFGETTVLGGGGQIGETTVLGPSQAAAVKIPPFLVREENNERIILDNPRFRIGKEKSYVDYFIGDNTAVSRSHADIITKDNKYYLIDMNSTNHTYVNGAMIQSSVEIPLEHGAKIRLANEEFTLNLY